MINHKNCVILLRFHAIQINSKLFTTPTPNFWHAGMDYYSNATSRLWIKTIPFYMQYLGPAKKGHIWWMTSSSKKKKSKTHTSLIDKRCPMVTSAQTKWQIRWSVSEISVDYTASKTSQIFNATHKKRNAHVPSIFIDQ